MARVYPDFTTISKLRTPTTDGEFFLLDYLSAHLDSSYEIFYNPILDGDRPDIIILKERYGAIIIEVKDWNLDLYSIDINNRWFVRTPTGTQEIRSPHQQAYRYKENLFNIHLPILGLSESINHSFWKVIHPYVYFHNNATKDVKSLFGLAISEIQRKKKQIQQNLYYKIISKDIYNKKMDYLDKKMKKIERDLRISFSTDNLDKFIQKIDEIKEKQLFLEEIYIEFKRRLSPCEWIYEQGKAILLDKTQQKYATSVNGFAKIKGVAGCGKTSILAVRALNAYARHKKVLILTYNLTLKHLIRDYLSHFNHHLKTNAAINEIEISNYHRFFISQLNNNGIKINYSNQENPELFFETLLKDTSIFKNKKTIKYGSIFIDEVQDYEKEWIMIIKDNFLETNGEMVLFGDNSQNIYGRDEIPLNKNTIRGFGEWKKLTKSYRSDDSLLISGFKQFQETFLIRKHDDLDIIESKKKHSSNEQLFMNLKTAMYKEYKLLDDIPKQIDIYIKEKKLHPNDIAIISSKKHILRQIESEFHKREKTMTMFATMDELKKVGENTPKCKYVLERYNYNIYNLEKVENKSTDEAYTCDELAGIEHRKKNFFQQNSGLIKFSTLHSFKGMESNTVFFIVDAADTPELIYTAITRAKTNLIIFSNVNNIYTEFLKKVYPCN